MWIESRNKEASPIAALVFLRHELALLNNVQVHVLIHRHALQLAPVHTQINQLLDLVAAVVRLQVSLVLGHDLRLSLLTTQLVAQRRLNHNLVQDGTVVQLNRQRIADGPQLGVVVILGKLRVLHALDLLAQALDQRRRRGFGAVGVVGGLQSTENEHDGAHVLHAVVTVGKVVHGLELLVDDTHAGFVRAAGDGLDVGGGFALGFKGVVDLLGGFDGGLGVEFGYGINYSRVSSEITTEFKWGERKRQKKKRLRTWVGHLEQDVLHHIATIRPLELELVALEQHIVETPHGRRQHSRHTRLALQHLEGEVHRPLACITGGPRLARHGVGRVAVCPQRLAINPRLRDSIGGLALVETQHTRDNSGGGDLDQHDVVQADLVVRVLEGQAALDLVRLDHALQNITDGENLAAGQIAAVLVGPVDPVGHGEDGAQVVRGVAPLGGQPAVIVVEPTDHGANVEGAVDGVQLEGRAKDLGSIGDHGARHDGA